MGVQNNKRSLLTAIKSALAYLNRNKYQIGVFSIFLIGFFFRLYPAVTRWFWEDELATIAFALAPYSWIEQLIRPMDDRPPLFYLFIRFCIKLTQNEFWLRLPIILQGTLSVYILFKAIERLSRKAAWIVLIMVTFSFVRIEYAWQLRDYGVLMVPTSIVIYFLVMYIEQLIRSHTVSRWTLVGMTIAFFFGCMVNYIFIIFTISVLSLLVIINLHVNYKKRKKQYWSFVKELALLQLPLVATLTYYLSRQFFVIKQTTEWFPDVSEYSYLLVNVIFLGFSNKLHELYSQNPLLMADYGLINIGIVAFFILCFYLLGQEKTLISRTIRILFYSGLYIYVTGYIGILLCSYILGTNIFLIRSFLRIGTLLIVSFGLGLYIIIKIGIRKEHVNKFIALVLFVYFCLFLRSYIDWYGPSLTDLKGGIPLQKEQQILNTVYEPDDQVLYLPLYYEVLYPFYYWRDDMGKWKSVMLFMKLFGNDKKLFFEQYHLKIDTDMDQFKNTQLDEAQGKIILLNWNRQDWKTEKIYAYCREVRKSDFEVIYQADNMYIAICQ